MAKAPPTTRTLVSGNLSFEAILRHELGDEKPPMKHGKRGPILAIAADDEGRERLLKHPNPRVRDLMEARIGIKSWPTHVKRLDTMTAQADACGGQLPVQLKYCGAHTGRWSGDGGWNAQNFGARAHPLISEIRGLILPPEGHVLIVSDFSAIEARGLAWLAGEEDTLDVFRRNGDIYVEMAGKLSGKPTWKPRDTDPPPVFARMKRLRQMGKVTVLGCGYGMGGNRMKDYAEGMGLVLSYTEAADLVDSYRNAVPAIPQFWKDIEEKVIYTARYTYPSDLRGLEITMDPAKDVLYIRFHSGRRLRYHHPRVDETDYYPRFWCRHPPPRNHRIDMWGGFLTENIVQAFCRDLLAPVILEAEAMGYRVPLHCHDEIVAVVPEGDADKAKIEIEQMMSVTPAWAKGLPLAAEAQITDRYCK
ncbi:MAG: DNA polymerase [Planctomycetota bacterium]